MNLRQTVILSLTSILASGLLCAAEKPNIIFIFTDDHCTQTLSAYDDTRIVTPNFDRLAKGGARFDRCYVTNSICGPSRAVIQTGKYSHKNGFVQNGDLFNMDQQTFPKLLRKVGYETAVIGKWHLKATPQGYDHFDILKGQGPYYNPSLDTGGSEAKATLEKNVGYTTDIISDKTLQWLKKERDPSKPFMLMTQHKAPHREWQPAPEYLNWLDDVELAEPATLFDRYEGRGSASKNQEMMISDHLNDRDLKFVPPHYLNEEQLQLWQEAYGPKNEAFLEKRDSMTLEEIVRWKYQRYAKDYLRVVKSVDDAVGELLDYLDESGLAENTIVIYSSDNGWYLGEHGWYDKRWMYEESLRVPLLVRWPKSMEAGQVVDEIVSNVDFAPTFLDLAGAPIPGDMQGRSLVPLMKGEKPNDWRDSFYYHYYEFPGYHSVARHYGVTTGKHKLIHFYQLGEWELYDLESDPDELQTVYGNADYAAITEDLKAKIAEQRRILEVPDQDPVRESTHPDRKKKAKAAGKAKP